MSDEWIKWVRPGYFGRQRDQKVAELNKRYGEGNWRLGWIMPRCTVYQSGQGAYLDDIEHDFIEACTMLYEESYFRWLKAHPEAVDFIAQHTECYDNAVSNIESGCDYGKQEAYSTHIQDIAVRNCLARLDREFEGKLGYPLQIRGGGPGEKYNPGHIPFAWPDKIMTPSLKPKWAELNSVEDFWQSNKWVMIRRELAK